MGNKDYDKGEVQKLKDRIENLRGENRRLKKVIKSMESELHTMKSAWKKTEEFLQDVTSGIPLEQLIKQKPLPKKALRKRQKQETRTPVDQREVIRDKWAKIVKENKNAEEMD